MGSFDQDEDEKFILAIFMLVVGFDGGLGHGAVDEVGGVGGVAGGRRFEETVDH